jgi:hypothetical protein
VVILWFQKWFDVAVLAFELSFDVDFLATFSKKLEEI